MKLLKHSLIIVFLFLQANLIAQILYPVRPVLQVNMPSTTYLTDFVAAGSNRFQLNLFQNDFNAGSYDVRLQITIDGNGINLVTNPNWMPEPITLRPGGNFFFGSDIEDYLNPQNMIVNGIDPVELLENGSGLPEGLYTICVKVFDYVRSDVAISEEACSMPTLLKNYPPTLIFPACGNTVSVTTGNQNILFNWQTNADFSIQAEYELTIVEVPEGVNPNDAINGSQTPILDAETIMMGTTFNYGSSQTELEEGKEYAYRIQVKDPMGLTTFENDGYSEVCTFDYGFNASGPVDLILPQDFESFGVADQVNLSWTRPTHIPNTQALSYEIKIVKIQPNQSPENAILYNTPWLEEQTPVIPANGTYTIPETPLPGESAFAWQIKAISMASGTAQQVGLSEMRVFYTRPEVDLMKAGNPHVNWFEILGLTYSEDIAGTNRKKISGSARVQVRPGANGEKRVVQFNNIIVEPISNYYQLIEGEIRNPISDFKIDLDNSGMYSEEWDYNGHAEFDAEEIIFTKDDFFLNGKINWHYPQATTESGIPTVQSITKEVIYNEYLLLDLNMGLQDTSFDLLNPIGFTVNYFSNSNFSLLDNVLTMNLNGSLTTPQDVQDIENERVSYNFFDVNNPYYWTMLDNSADKNIRIVKGTTLQLDPQKVTFDMSEEESPAKITAVEWRGLYFDNFKMIFPTDFDLGNQLILDNEQTYDFFLAAGNSFHSWVDGDGLQYKVSKSYLGDSGPTASFNTFRDNFTEWNIEIIDNSIQSGNIQGYIYIPLFSADEKFTYTIPFDDNGLQQSFLDNSIAGREVIFNGDKPDLKVAMTVEQAVFKDNERLEMDIALEWASVEVDITNITSLSLWGNTQLGFGVPNGKKYFEQQVTGLWAGNYDITFDKVSLGKNNLAYWVNLEGSVFLSDDVSGENGVPPVVMVSSTTGILESAIDAGVIPHSTANEGPIDNNVGEFIAKAEESGEAGGELNIMTDFKIDLAVAKGQGKLYTFHDHPDWGSGFQGIVSGSVNMYLNEWSTYLQVLMGRNDNVNFWMLEFEAAVGHTVTPTPILTKFAKSHGGKAINAVKNYAAKKSTWIAKKMAEPPGNGRFSKVKKYGGKFGKKALKNYEKYTRLFAISETINVMAIRGRVYHHMNDDFNIDYIMDTDYTNIPTIGDKDITYSVDNSIMYGGAAEMDVIDTNLGGILLMGTGGVELNYGSNGIMNNALFEFQADVMNMEFPTSFHLFESYGVLNISPPTQTITGGLKAKTNPDYAFACGGGAMNFFFNPSTANFNLGSPQHPIQGIGPCYLPNFKGYFNFNSSNDDTSLDMGLYYGLNVDLVSPWIGGGLAKFRPRIDFDFEMGGSGGFQIQPEFIPQNFAVSVQGNFSAGVDYWVGAEMCVWDPWNGTSCWTVTLHEGYEGLGSIYFSGNLNFRIDPTPINLTGHVSGGISVPYIGSKEVGFDIDLDLQ